MFVQSIYVVDLHRNESEIWIFQLFGKAQTQSLWASSEAKWVLQFENCQKAVSSVSVNLKQKVRPIHGDVENVGELGLNDQNIQQPISRFCFCSIHYISNRERIFRHRNDLNLRSCIYEIKEQFIFITVFFFDLKIRICPVERRIFTHFASLRPVRKIIEIPN